MRFIIFVLLLANTAISQTRLPQNPILTSASSDTIGTNINGPSLIRVPVWVEKPLGRYYLYFAHHAGKFIRLAYANQLSGPWNVYEPGTLQLNDVKACHDHDASPDVHVDEQETKIRMYFHCPVEGRRNGHCAAEDTGGVLNRLASNSLLRRIPLGRRTSVCSGGVDPIMRSPARECSCGRAMA